MKKNYVKPTIESVEIIGSENIMAGSELFDTNSSPTISDIESDSKQYNGYSVWDNYDE